MQLPRSSMEKKLEKSPEIHFLPYIGQDYGVDGYRILLVGEAHYGNEKEASNRLHTRLLVEEGIENVVAGKSRDRWGQQVQNIAAMLSGEKYGAVDIWEQVSYTVFFQCMRTKMCGTKKEDVATQLYTARAAFFRLLDILSPYYVILLGETIEKNRWLLNNDGVHVVEPSIPVYAYQKYPQTFIWSCLYSARDFNYTKEHERLLKVCGLNAGGYGKNEGTKL